MNESNANESSTHSSKSPADLESFVDELIGQMNSEFESVGEKILGRMSEMETRILDLEHSIVSLMDVAGLHQSSDVPSRVGGVSPMKSLREESPKSVCTPNKLKSSIEI